MLHVFIVKRGALRCASEWPDVRDAPCGAGVRKAEHCSSFPPNDQMPGKRNTCPLLWERRDSGSWPHCIRGHVAENRQEGRLDYNTSRPASSDPLPPEGLHHRGTTQPSKTLPPTTGHQGLTCILCWNHDTVSPELKHVSILTSGVFCSWWWYLT